MFIAVQLRTAHARCCSCHRASHKAYITSFRRSRHATTARRSPTTRRWSVRVTSVRSAPSCRVSRCSCRLPCRWTSSFNDDDDSRTSLLLLLLMTRRVAVLYEVLTLGNTKCITDNIVGSSCRLVSADDDDDCSSNFTVTSHYCHECKSTVPLLLTGVCVVYLAAIS